VETLHHQQAQDQGRPGHQQANAAYSVLIVSSVSSSHRTVIRLVILFGFQL
jgi:hypothetical protein